MQKINDEKQKQDFIKKTIENTEIHVMPEQFRPDYDRIKKIKTIGLIIMVGGIILITSIAILFYYFFLKKPLLTKQPISQPIENVEKIEKLDCNKIQNCENYTDENQCDKNQCNIESIECSWDQIDKKCIEKIVEKILTLCEQKQGYCIANEELCKTDFIMSEDQELLTSCSDLKCCIPSLSTTTTATTTITTSSPIIVAQDSDNDGLSDKEENILGTQNNNIDSDNDGYDDLLEIINLYNPTEKKPDKLINNQNIAKYINNTFNYSIFYPTKWQQQTVGGDDSIIFKSNDEHFIQVITQLNDNQLSITDWYKSQFENESIPYNRQITTNTWKGIKSEDGLILYLTDNNYKNIYTLSYTPKLNDALEYQRVFEMMIESFTIN